MELLAARAEMGLGICFNTSTELYCDGSLLLTTAVAGRGLN